MRSKSLLVFGVVFLLMMATGLTLLKLLGDVVSAAPLVSPSAVASLDTVVELALSPGYRQRARPGQTVVYTHVLTNVGSMTDTFLLEVESFLDWPAMLLIAAHEPTNLGPLRLGPDMTATLALSLTVPKHVVSGTIEHTTITATALSTHTVNVSVQDVTVAYRVPGFELSPGTLRTAIENSTVSFMHTLTHTGAMTDIFTIEAGSHRGWTVTLLSDVTPPQTTIQLPLRLAELATVNFWAHVNIPADVPLGSRDKISVTVTSLLDENITQTVTDVIVLGEPALVYLPSVRRNFTLWPPRAKLGVDFSVLAAYTDVITYDYPLARDMGTEWFRLLLPWSSIETAPGEYNWDEYDPVFARLADLEFKGLVTIYGAPAWAAEESCGPLSDTLALENFLDVLVPRYTDVVEAWEFINEPDGTAPYYYGPIIGCWGPYPDEYAKYLAVFSAKIRALDPSAQVLFGSMAYDAWSLGIFTRDFFEKALQYGAGEAFDVVGVHYYPINPDVFPTMASKIEALQVIMDRNAVHDKRVWVTETGMWINGGGSEALQRDFIVREFTRGFGAGADNIFWFEPREYQAPEGVAHRWLISEDHQPVYAYTTFQHFAKQIENLYCAGPYLEVPGGVEAYKYEHGGRTLYVLWSNAGFQSVTLPASGDVTLTGRDGEPLETPPIVEGQVTLDVGWLPVFVDVP